MDKYAVTFKVDIFVEIDNRIDAEGIGQYLAVKACQLLNENKITSEWECKDVNWVEEL